MKRALPWLVLAAVVCSASAFAQDDDDLAPLAPKKPKPAAAKPKPKPKPPPAAAKPKVTDDDDLAPIAVSKGELAVKLPQNLSNATITIDGKDVGTFPISTQTLPSGEHVVKVRRAGYAEFTKKVTIATGKLAEVEAKLTATHAFVSVTSDVAEAQVLINGALKGTAPIKDLEVLPGAVEIVVRKDGYKDDKRKVTLVAGKDYPISITMTGGSTSVIAANDRPVDTKLTPDDGSTDLDTTISKPAEEETPIYGRWYFWAGVAAVAVGAAVVTGVAVNQSQPPLRLNEETVCKVNGGRCDICVGFQCAGSALMKF